MCNILRKQMFFKKNKNNKNKNRKNKQKKQN